MAGALDGIRVIDFGQWLAGPLTARLLADQGAEVTHVDPPGGPCWKTVANSTLQRGKKSLVLDLKSAADVACARRLIGSADVLIENFRPGVMDRLGLGWDAVRRNHDRLIYCSLPGFAADDPRAAMPAWEGVLAAARRGAAPHYPARPEPNFRSVHALIGTEENIIIPQECAGAVQPEGQLAVVMGKKARHVSRDNALDYVFGYSIGNDISQREWQRDDRTMFRGKNCDTFKPFGPWIVTGLDPTQFRLIVRHNGTVWEDFSSADQIWDTATWIQELSRYTTLHPGDVLWMGTQGADGDMVPGDVIEVEISGIGILRNYVVAEA